MMSSMNQNIPESDREEPFDTTGLLLAYLGHWRWFLLSVALCCIAGVLAVYTKKPLYQVDASIYLNEDYNHNQNNFSLNPIDPMLTMKGVIDPAELEVMKSRSNVIRIVDSLDLAYSYYRKGMLRNTSLYLTNPISARMSQEALNSLKSPIEIRIKTADHEKGLYNITAETKIEKEKQKFEYEGVALPFDLNLPTGSIELTPNAGLSHSTEVEPYDGTEIIKIMNPKTAAAVISGQLSINYAKDSEKIINISICTDNGAKGMAIIRGVVDYYNRNIIEEKNRSSVQTEAFIIDRLVMINDELRDVEKRLQDYRQTHHVTDIHQQAALNLQLKSEYDEQIAQVDAELMIIGEIERMAANADAYTTLPAALQNNTVAKIIEDYNKKVNQLNRALEGSTPDNPLIRNLSEELSRDKVRIIQNLATLKGTLLAQRKQYSQLEGRSAGALASTPTVDKGLQEIFREQQVKVNIYTFLLQRREETALQKTLATNSARLIDEPTLIGRVQPQPMMTMVIAFIIGLAIPAMIILLRRILFPVFSDQEELERITKVPVLGEICNSDTKNGHVLVIGKDVATPVAELFRLLRNNISFTRSGNSSKVILVTSSVSGEGKTFISSNLALTYALMGKKVLVIGMDLRRPMLAHNFGLTNQKGLTNYLAGKESDIDSLIHQSKINENLYILPAGPVPPNPNELLMSDKMTRLMNTLRERFDYIIIDSAPIGVISDTFLITHLSDLQLFVTRANYSTRNSLKVLHQSIDAGKFSSVYIVLNGVDISSSAYAYKRYGEYGRYARAHTYGYGYGYGAAKEDKSKNKA